MLQRITVAQAVSVFRDQYESLVNDVEKILDRLGPQKSVETFGSTNAVIVVSTLDLCIVPVKLELMPSEMWWDSTKNMKVIYKPCELDDEFFEKLVLGYYDREGELVFWNKLEWAYEE
jgi:hypothetical protein